MFASITPCELPPAALLRKYLGGGGYTDCFVTEIATPASHPEYVEAFYTTVPFRLERLILKLLVNKPSTDADVRRLARGETELFAAWSVEARAPNQLLLCDYQRATRSWLMVASIEDGRTGTRLYFGTAIVPVQSRSGPRLSLGFRALLGFHKLYSRVLLAAARSRVA